MNRYDRDHNLNRYDSKVFAVTFEKEIIVQRLLSTIAKLIKIFLQEVDEFHSTYWDERFENFTNPFPL